MATTVDNYQRVAEQLTFDNITLIIATGINYAAGFGQYVYTIQLLLQDGKGPMPFWMHSFYLAHDSFMCYAFGQAAPKHDNHWFLTGTSTAMFAWSTLEIWVIHRSVTTDRNANFSSLFGPNPPLGKVLSYVFGLQVAMYAIVILGAEFMGEDSFMQWFCFTNIIMAIGPANEALVRTSRKGLSLGFSFLVVVGTIATFAPFGFWALTLPEIFAQPVYYAVGVVCFLYSVWGYWITAQLFK